MASVALLVSTAKPTGPYPVARVVREPLETLDATGRHLDVLYPDVAGGRRFPFISYAHGFDDTGEVDYRELGPELASWGYVLGFANSCEFGCIGSCETLRLDPPCFGRYYEQQLHVIDWARSPAAARFPINTSVGVGIAGHSMGGQATVFSGARNATQYGIKAAAMHHAFTHIFPAVQVPFLAFTGTADDVAPPSMAERIFDAPNASSTRGIVNKVGANHHEPSSDYNPGIARYTVAWMKLFLDGTPASLGMDWEGMLFGNGTDSLCGGGDGSMKQCELLRP